MRLEKFADGKWDPIFDIEKDAGLGPGSLFPIVT